MAARKKITKRNKAKSADVESAKKNGKAKSTEILRRPFLISVGALAMAEETASEMIDSLMERGEKARKAGEKYMKDLNGKDSKKTAKPKARKKSAKRGDDIITRALGWLNIPTADEVKKLSKKVDALTKKVA